MTKAHHFLFLIVIAIHLPATAHARDRSPNAGLEMRPILLGDAAGGEGEQRKPVNPRQTTSALLVSSDIDAEITGPIVRVTVTQRFQNTSESWMEGLYRFPLPENASVSAMTLLVGDRQITGMLQEREEATRTYRQAVRQGRRAALLSELRG